MSSADFCGKDSNLNIESKMMARASCLACCCPIRDISQRYRNRHSMPGTNNTFNDALYKTRGQNSSTAGLKNDGALQEDTVNPKNVIADVAPLPDDTLAITNARTSIMADNFLISPDGSIDEEFYQELRKEQEAIAHLSIEDVQAHISKWVNDQNDKDPVGRRQPFALPSRLPSVKLEKTAAPLSLSNLSISDISEPSSRYLGKIEAQRVEQARLEAERRRKEEEFRRQREAEEVEQKARNYRPAPPASLFSELSQPWRENINEQLAKRSFELPRSRLTRQDINTLLPSDSMMRSGPAGWLNDAVITAALDLIVSWANQKCGIKERKKDITPKFHAFSPYFWSNNESSGPQSTRRWTEKAGMAGKRLLDVETVLMPCNLGGMHWTLLVVSPRRRTIEFFDSMALNQIDPNTKKALEIGKKWVHFTLGEHYKENEWTAMVGITSQQVNGRDCGVFTVTNAKMIVLGWDPEKAFTATDATEQRMRLFAELLNGGLSDEFIQSANHKGPARVPWEEPVENSNEAVEEKSKENPSKDQDTAAIVTRASTSPQRRIPKRHSFPSLGFRFNGWKSLVR